MPPDLVSAVRLCATKHLISTDFDMCQLSVLDVTADDHGARRADISTEHESHGRVCLPLAKY